MLMRLEFWWGLIWINWFLQAQQQGLLFEVDEEKAQQDFFNDIKKNIQDAEYDKAVEEGMLQLIQDIIISRNSRYGFILNKIFMQSFIFSEKRKNMTMDMVL